MTEPIHISELLKQFDKEFIEPIREKLQPEEIEEEPLNEPIN